MAKDKQIETLPVELLLADAARATEQTIKKSLTPLLVDAKTASRLCGVGLSLWYEMASTGRLGPLPIKFNSKKLYIVSELENWILHRCPPRDKWSQFLKEENGDSDKK